MVRPYIPRLEDLWFRQALLADGQTMSYNHAYGGTIAFPGRPGKDGMSAGSFRAERGGFTGI